MKTLILFLITSYSLIAQNSFDYEVGDPYKVIDGYYKYYFSNVEKGKMLSVKFGKKVIHLQSFNARTLKEVKYNKITDLPRKYTISAVTEINERIYFFYTIWDKRTKSC